MSPGPEGNKALVLVQPYLWRGQIQVKFPGGCSLPGETSLDTAVRELKQETFLELVPGGMMREIVAKELPPRDDRVHTKYFFATTLASLQGELRAEPMQEGNSNGGETLMSPEWREVDSWLLESLFGAHREALVEAVKFASVVYGPFAHAAHELYLT